MTFRALKLTLVPLVFSLASCGGGSDVAEFLGFSSEVTDVSASSDAVTVGESVSIFVDLTAADAFGFSDVYILVRYSPQLRLIESSISYNISGVIDSEDPFNSGFSTFGQLFPVCEGAFPFPLNDHYFAVLIPEEEFSFANNPHAELRFQLVATIQSEQAFVVATARDDLDTSACQTLSPGPEGSVPLTILPNSG